MKLKALVAMMAVSLVAVGAAQATISASYGWEDGVGTILGKYGNVANEANVGDKAYTGSRSLYMEETPLSGTPQAYVAFITGLTDGDIIDASFYAWDDTPSASPSARIWAHYAQSSDVDSYAGSASGPSTYSAGTGWDLLSAQWTFDSDGNTRDALVIEYRLYSGSTPDPTPYWCDDVWVQVTNNDNAMIHFAPEPASLALLAIGGLAAIRRRR